METRHKTCNKLRTTTEKKLKIFHQNVDRLSNKQDIVNDFLHANDPDVIILTEHGLSEPKLLNTIITGYIIIDYFCREKHIKGGVAIYVRQNLENVTASVNGARYSKELECELAAVKISINKIDIFLIGIYRPDKNFEIALESLNNLLDKIPTWNSTVIIMGDINIDRVVHKTKNTELKEFLATHNIKRLLLPATRITSHSATSIDLVCTNLHPEEVKVTVLNTFIADHTGQICTVPVTKNEALNTISIRRNFCNENLRILKHLLGKEIWEDVYESECVETAYNNFISTVTFNINLSCPLKKFRHQNKKKIPPSDPVTKRKKECFLKAQETFMLHGTDGNKADAIQKKKDYDLHLKNIKKTQNTDFINKAENKSKAMWKVINSEKQSKHLKNEPIQLKIDNKITSDPQKVAEELNYYFVNAVTNILPQSHNNSIKTITINSEATLQNLLLWSTTPFEVSKTIRSLKSKNSSGFDEISSNVLKSCEKELVYPLVNIINKSFAQGKFPTNLKTAKVYPKFKQGASTEVKNYRPISLISTFSKVIEKIVLTRLLDHLSRNQLLPDEQHGFTANKSTNSAIISITEQIIKAIEDGDTTTAVFLDYSKAFDCIRHDLLVKKLENMGIRGTAGEWFKSYLTDRSQAVEVKYVTSGVYGTKTSEPLPVKSGVPQGSVLGPILYIIFTSDFPHYLADYCRTLMYADDTVLLLRNKNSTDLEIQSYIALGMAQQYCQENSLVLNERKSQQLILGKKKEETAGLPDVMEVSHAKYLGVIIDDKLTWSDHLDKLCCKLSSALYVLRRLKQISSDETMRTAYFALFEAHIRYGLPVWGNTSKTNTQRVLILQKRAMRILAGLGPRESCRAAFCQFKVLTVVSIFILETALYAKRQNLQRGSDIHNHNTRRANNITLPIHHLSLYEKQPTYMGAKFLNILPEEVKNATCEKKNRKNIVNWLQERPCYTVEEFENWRQVFK